MLRAASMIRHRLARTLRGVARRLDVPAVPVDPLVRERHPAAVVQSSSKHNMLTHPDEAFYAELYLHWIRTEFAALLAKKNTRVLDIGCGQGRLGVPLARLASQGHVLGVDLSSDAVALANLAADDGRVANATFEVGDALAFVQKQPDQSCDLMIITEVCFYFPAYRALLEDLSRVMKRDGGVAISFRSRYFSLLHWIKQRAWDDVDRIVSEREGLLSSSWYAWHTSQDIRTLLEASRCKEIRLRGIGVCSGIEGDPLAEIARPSTVWPEELDRLRRTELALSEDYSDCGRYILALARF